MRVRRLITALSVCLAASASLAVAQPKGDPKKGPAAPAKEPAKDPKAPAPAPGPGTGAGAGGEVVQMSEDTPPADIEGKDENPDAPRTVGEEPAPVVVTQEAAPRPTGYPIEEAMRPITLPKNMSEVAIGPHAQISPYRGADALRARYGITDKIQLGLTYVLGGIYDDPATANEKIGFHPGKAVGLDLTVMIKDWLGVRVGVPVYIDPLALSLALGAPMKWQFAGGKYALGALDDFLNIRMYRFVPSFYQEFDNALGAAGTGEMGSNTIQSRGYIRFSGFGIMQYQPKLAFIARLGVSVEDFSTTRSNAGDNSGLKSFLRAGLQYSVRKYLDLGFSVGFDDLARGGSFAPAGLLAFRI
jgi:hypothetical protein